MNRCIYCGKDDKSVTFNTREHVIPVLLGVFDNNVTLTECVCDNCNNNVFAPLENRFKEDTEEGVTCQMINFANSHQIRVRNRNFKMTTDLGLGEALFNETFPFLKLKDGKFQITFVPQIKVRGYAGEGYIILLIEDIKKLPRGRKRFRKLKKLLEGVKSKDVSIFTYGGDDPQNLELNEAIELVRELGVSYKPGTQKFAPPHDPLKPKVWAEVNIEGKIDSDTARIIAKIAFNYFAYCATQCGLGAILYHKNFSKVKSYILGDLQLPLAEIIIEQPTYHGIIADEREASTRIRLVGHLVTIDNEKGSIVARVSFAGRLVYTILLGETPSELNRTDFGNGHIFDPFHKKIHGLTKDMAKRGTENKVIFTLFNGV